MNGAQRCHGNVAACRRPAQFRVSWRERNRRLRPRLRTKLCEQCLKALRGSPLTRDVVSTPLKSGRRG